MFTKPHICYNNCNYFQVQTARKTFTVEVTSKADVYFMTRPYRRMEAGRGYHVECGARGGNPKPGLVALVGTEEEVRGFSCMVQ